jgi:hypothetical protein
LLPAIVEDVSPESDPFSFRTQAIERLERATARVPEGAKWVARQVFITRSTKLYQALHGLTQASDFMGRYTLYEHLMKEGVIDPTNPTGQRRAVTRDEAIHTASEAFIQYDMPLHRTAQALENYGFLYFSKYLLRVQRVIVETARENPARTLLMVLLGRLFDLPTVYDTALLNRLGYNPFKSGLFETLDVVEDLATIDAARQGLSLLH